MFAAFFFYTLLPVLLTIVLERTAIFLLARKKHWQQWCQNQFWLEPNSISRGRYFAGFLSVFFYHFVNPPVGIYWFSFWMISDITDGSIARILKKDTTEGAIIDPLSDKLLYFPPLFYAAYWLGSITPIWLWLFFVVDVFGQLTRSFSKRKSANLFGKGKTLLCTITLALIFFDHAYQLKLFAINDFLIFGLLLLGLSSFIFRLIPNYWYANILSLLNLLCGVVGIAFAFLGFPILYTFLLVFLGQVLDLYDGRAAERWGSTPKGEIFDDLADGTNFGLAVGSMVFVSFDHFVVGALLALFYVFCTLYRLWRFLKDKKTANAQFGVDRFNGLPSPAGALCVGSGLLMLQEQSVQQFLQLYSGNAALFIQSLLVAGVSLLMVSHLPYVHVGRVLLSRMPLVAKVVLYTLLVTLGFISLEWKSNVLFFGCILIISLFYIFFGALRLKIFRY